MKRPWQVWLVFVVCVSGAAAAMAWLTHQALQADELRRAAEANAELEQRVSLALWRIDTELAPILAEEIIRPSSAYQSPKIASAGANYAGQQAESAVQYPQQVVQTAPAQSLEWPSSPLLVSPPLYVLLHFEVDSNGSWQSPQVPPNDRESLATGLGLSPVILDERRARLTELSHAIELPQLLAMLPDATLPPLAAISRSDTELNAAPSAARFNELADQYRYLDNRGNVTTADSLFGPPLPSQPSPDETLAMTKGSKAPVPAAKSAQAAKVADFEQRSRRLQTVVQQNIVGQQMRAGNYSMADADSSTDVVGVSRPVWVDDRLLLVRRVERSGGTAVQGCWLDWQQLRTRLLAQVVDVFPAAELAPVGSDVNVDPGRMLAGLPVRLMVGPAAVVAATSPTLRWALWIGWGAIALAAGAAAVLLGGVMALSERRAAFVSSVTHELRTPLTTFRMYAEMLARGMVPDAERRQEYLHTLQREAERLTLLVENVLAYARLERGRKPQAADRVTPAALLERVGPRLAHRAQEADMQCEIEIDPAAADQEFTTDQGVVEQILFNLVDNAAKYACTATERRIHVSASRNGRTVEFAVRDHGPGIQRNGRPNRMRPFGKSAEQAAESAPGVGLGLALCGRLARQLGGRLEITAAPGGGAVVSLCLPV